MAGQVLPGGQEVDVSPGDGQLVVTVRPVRRRPSSWPGRSRAAAPLHSCPHAVPGAPQHLWPRGAESAGGGAGSVGSASCSTPRSCSSTLPTACLPDCRRYFLRPGGLQALVTRLWPGGLYPKTGARTLRCRQLLAHLHLGIPGAPSWVSLCF